MQEVAEEAGLVYTYTHAYMLTRLRTHTHTHAHTHTHTHTHTHSNTYTYAQVVDISIYVNRYVYIIVYGVYNCKLLAMICTVLSTPHDISRLDLQSELPSANTGIASTVGTEQVSDHSLSYVCANTYIVQ